MEMVSYIMHIHNVGTYSHGRTAIKIIHINPLPQIIAYVCQVLFHGYIMHVHISMKLQKELDYKQKDWIFFFTFEINGFFIKEKEKKGWDVVSCVDFLWRQRIQGYRFCRMVTISLLLNARIKSIETQECALGIWKINIFVSISIPNWLHIFGFLPIFGVHFWCHLKSCVWKNNAPVDILL